MKIAEINTVYYGSTGKIMLQIAKTARSQGHVVKTFSKTWKQNPVIGENHSYIGTFFENIVHRIAAPLTSAEGYFSVWSTARLIRKLRAFGPDVVHLHNLHGWYLNYSMLFRYLKENQIRVVWTLHDCWAFTGHCAHFEMAGCGKWKTGCHHCPQYRGYPQMYFDRTKEMWKKKKEWFTGIPELTIVTPSQWLADLVKESFLGVYPVKVIHNGIDLSVFRPTESNFRKQYHCEDKKIVLGVAFGWGKRKGLDVFRELAGRLGPDYQIVLVGTDDSVDNGLPENVITIHRTHNQRELAEIYTAADLLVNPTREDNFPTVNLEALACGTPVLTFRTGGSPECIDETCGAVVDQEDVATMEQKIQQICTQKPFAKEDCIRRAENYNMHQRFEEYVRLYEE